MGIKEVSTVFCVCLEGRIKLRHLMLMEHGFSLLLPEMFKYSDAEFNVQLIDMRAQLVEEGRSG